jgi:peptidylprolyl isomerase
LVEAGHGLRAYLRTNELDKKRGENGVRQAENGDTVRVSYTGTLSDGSEFDSSAQRGLLESTIGNGEVFSALERVFVGMSAGDTKTVTLDPADAFGARDPGLVHTVERARIPAEVDLNIGTSLQASDSNGNQHHLVVVDLDNENVTLDANHPLAGEALTFMLNLAEFVD